MPPSSPLYENGDLVIERYQDVERLGNMAVKDLLTGDVIIQEKLDGANMTVATGPKGLIIASRRTLVYDDNTVIDPFKGAVEYVLNHKGLRAMADAFILRGEWLIRRKHGVKYPDSVCKVFYVFDVQKYNGEYVHPLVYIPLLEANDIKYAPVLREWQSPTSHDLADLLVRHPESFLSTAEEVVDMEGIVVKRFNFVNEFGMTKWAKLVREEFVQRKAEHTPVWASAKHENSFAAKVVTGAFVKKTIAKIEHPRLTPVTIRDMSEILSRVWYDIFHEELWDFVNSKKGRSADIAAVRRAVEREARAIALTYLNGFDIEEAA